MKRSRLSYDEWTCIPSKDLRGKRVNTEFFSGYIGLIDIYEVSEPLVWEFNEENIVFCDKGIKWLSMLPSDDYYCITAMMSEKDEILLWYIDMIAEQGVDADGVPYFDDLYLDLVVYPDGTVVEDDKDELDTALRQGDITQEQYQLALETSVRLKESLLCDINKLRELTKKCYGIMR